MISEKRNREGKQRMYNGKVVVPDAYSVDRDKARAIIELRKIMQQIKTV
jgi:predicted kinase